MKGHSEAEHSTCHALGVETLEEPLRQSRGLLLDQGIGTIGGENCWLLFI